MSVETGIPLKPHAEKRHIIGLDSGEISQLQTVGNALQEYRETTSLKPDLHLNELQYRVDLVKPQQPTEDLTRIQEMQLIRRVRKLVKKTVTRNERPAALEAVGISPELAKQSRRALLKENAKTTVSTIFSEVASYGSGVASAAMDLQEKVPVHNPWIIGGLIAISYPAIWGSLWVNEKANAMLLKAKGIATDLGSKAGHETGNDEVSKRKRAKKGYWGWHGFVEGVYLATAGAMAANGNVRESAAFQIVSNGVGSLKLLGQAGITAFIASREFRRQRASLKEVPQTSPTTVFEKQ